MFIFFSYYSPDLPVAWLKQMQFYAIWWYNKFYVTLLFFHKNLIEKDPYILDGKN